MCDTPAELVAMDNKYMKYLPKPLARRVYDYLFSDFYYYYSNWLGDSMLKYDITPLI
jgi:hypothetical protein